jgi:hypothetical protein
MLAAILVIGVTGWLLKPRLASIRRDPTHQEFNAFGGGQVNLTDRTSWPIAGDGRQCGGAGRLIPLTHVSEVNCLVMRLRKRVLVVNAGSEADAYITPALSWGVKVYPRVYVNIRNTLERISGKYGDSVFTGGARLRGYGRRMFNVSRLLGDERSILSNIYSGGMAGILEANFVLQTNDVSIQGQRALNGEIRRDPRALGNFKLRGGSISRSFGSVSSLFVSAIHLDSEERIDTEDQNSSNLKNRFKLIPPILFYLASNCLTGFGYWRGRNNRCARDLWIGAGCLYVGFTLTVWSGLILTNSLGI